MAGSRSSAPVLGEREFIAMMALVMALQALAIDAMLPALGAIAGDLGVTDPNHRQLVVGSFLVAAGVGALIPGALADRHGRRPVLLATIAGFVVFSLGCALSNSFEMLIGLRIATALSSAGLAVLPSAIARDRFSGDRMARMVSTIGVVFMAVPMIAPTLGQAVLLVAGWRWIFAVLGVLGSVVWVWVWLRLAETAPVADAVRLPASAWARAMVRVAFNRAAFGYVLGNTLVIGGLFGYVNCVEQLVAEHFGAGRWFPLLFAVTAFGLAVANLTNAAIVERFGARRVSHCALLAFIALAGVQIWQAWQPAQTLLGFMPVMALNIGLMGFIGANFGALALLPFRTEAGAASSVQTFFRTGLGATLGIVIGQAYDGSARPLALAFLANGVVALALVAFSERGKLFGPREPTPVEPFH